MVRKKLIVVLITGVLLALNASAFSIGDQQDNNSAPPVEHTQLDPATGGHGWQDPDCALDSNSQLSSRDESETPGGFSSLTDLAFQLYFEYLIKQQQ